jgi:hypothetical protein
MLKVVYILYMVRRKQNHNRDKSVNRSSSTLMMQLNSYSYYYPLFLSAREITLKASVSFALMFLEE